jgi:ribosome-associated translation inhibitor RaiA
MMAPVTVADMTAGQVDGADAIVRVNAVLATLGRLALAGRVRFEDENGPKGGVAVRCTIDAQIVRRPLVHVASRATSARVAFVGALDKLERRLRREQQAARARRRRPRLDAGGKAIAGGGGFP